MPAARPPQPSLHTGREPFDRMYALAVRTLLANVKPWKDGLLRTEAPAIMAGEHYHKPWTRDAAYNTWNAAALLLPEAARNTLLSTLKEEDGQVLIGGQYWDAIAWTTGAWAYYAVTGDADFLPLAYQATVNSLAWLPSSTGMSACSTDRPVTATAWPPTHPHSTRPAARRSSSIT